MPNKSKEILLVEDDIDIRDLVTSILEDEGYSVVAKNNGQEALDYLRAVNEHPDLILLDMMMPVKDGLQFREEQRNDETLCDIPVVVMSANNNIEKRFKFQAVQDCLKKPLDMDTLLECVKKHSKPT